MFDFEPYRRKNRSIDLEAIFRGLPTEYNSKTLEWQRAITYIRSIENFRPIHSRQLAATILSTSLTILELKWTQKKTIYNQKLSRSSKIN